MVERIGPVAATGICLLVVMLLGPVVWPWYLAPAFALLGATQLGRWRASVLVLCALFAVEVFPVGVKSKPVLEGNHLVSLLLIVLIAAISSPRRWPSNAGTTSPMRSPGHRRPMGLRRTNIRRRQRRRRRRSP